MTNSIDEVYTAFFDKIEQDTSFFAYFELTEEQALAVAKERARSYLREACSYLRRNVPLDFTLSIETGENGEEHFSELLTDDEVELLSEIMVLPYFERGLAKLMPKLNTFSASELKLLHSPANERQSYLELINNQRQRVNYLIADYYSKDRITGAEKMINNQIPEEEE